MMHTHPFLRGSLLVLVLALATVGGVVAQNPEVNTSAGLTAQGAPLALRGYDPVSYFEEGEPRPGTAEHSAVHEGVTYRFASNKSLRAFEADPDRYLPEYGGFCAYGVSVGAKFDGDPQVWKIVDGKLYLNLNPEIQKAWNQDVSGAIRTADGHWPKIRRAAPESLKPQG